MLSDELKRRLKNRLARAQGQLRGVEVMIERGDYCIDIVNQLIAARNAINRISSIILEDHLRTCVKEAMTSPDEYKAEEVIAELVDTFERALND